MEKNIVVGTIYIYGKTTRFGKEKNTTVNFNYNIMDTVGSEKKV